MAGYDSRRTGYNATSQLPTCDTGGAWLRRIGGSPTGPVADEQRLYAGLSVVPVEGDGLPESVFAFDAQSGEELWGTVLTPPNEVAEEFEGIRSQGLIRAGENVYVTTEIRDTGRSMVVALDPTDGEITWQKTLPGHVVPDLGFGDGAIFVSLSGGERDEQDSLANIVLYAFELDSMERWQYSLDSHVIQPLSVADGIVYAGLGDGRMVAMGSEDGEFYWERTVVEYERTGGIPIQETPSVGEERIYVAGSDRSLHAISREDGSHDWSFELNHVEDGWRTSPAIFDGTVYAGARHGGLIALDSDEGTVLWQIEEAPTYRQIAVTDQGLVSAWNGTMEAFDHDGIPLWSFEMEVPEGGPGDVGVNLSPTVIAAHDRVYVLLSDGRLYAIGSR
jgi:outer membrane protein assembly factor BamB